MELHEAVEKIGNELQSWALRVTSGGDVEHHFEWVSHGNIASRLVQDFSRQMGKEVAAEVWPQISDAPTDGFGQLVDAVHEKTMNACWSFFAMGWMMGTPEIQAQPKTRETFLKAVSGANRDELRLLERRFRSEDFLEERFNSQFQAAALLVSKVFSDSETEMTEHTVGEYCAVSSSLPMYEAYEMGAKSRTLIEEDLTISQLAEDFDTD